MNYSGNVITKNPVQPSLTSAPGVWSLQEAQNAVANGTWPIPGVINPISKSLRFNSADSAYLNRTPAVAGNRKTWTWSAWVKRSGLGVNQVLFAAYTGVGTDTNLFSILFNSSNQISIDAFTLNWRVTSAVYRDVSSWYHIVLAFDTTQSTASNRIKLYVNGAQVTVFGTSNDPTQNTDYVINSTNPHYIGVNAFNVSSNYGNYYMTEINFVDGQALTPSAFGLTDPNTGVWVPKKYTGTYGTNGFYLNFSDSNSTTLLGYDYSGNGNNWTPNNFSVTAGAGNDSLTDVPTLWTPYNVTSDTGGVVRGNYATLNPLQTGIDLSNGNLDFTNGAANESSYSTIAMTSGKWYCEAIFTVQTSTSILGISAIGSINTGSFIGSNSGSYSWDANGQKYNNGSGVLYGSARNVNDVIGCAFDLDAGTLTFYLNGVSQGIAYSSIPAGTYFFGVSSYNSTGNINFGQRPFAYTPPSGYKSLCTTNLPTPTIGAASTTLAGNYFNTVLYTGTGSALGVTGVGFQPDFVWIKSRSAATDHALYDAVRGVQKQLESNTTDAETTETQGLTAFDTNGFNLGTLAQVNTVNATYVGWNWKANGAGSSNTAGTVTTTVSVNQTAGFSIMKYTGTGTNSTFGHGLGVAPVFWFAKNLSTTSGWLVETTILGGVYVGELNTTGAFSAAGGYAANAPTSTVIYNGANTSINNNGSSHILYAFAPVAGYSAFGSYTGNGSTDGPFIYTGFRPKYVMIKSSSNSYSWYIEDTSRATYNAAGATLAPNTSAAEDTAWGSGQMDILSNGFKLRISSAESNGNGLTYIYAAFAESPFKYANAR